MCFLDDSFREQHQDTLNRIEISRKDWMKALRLAEENGLLWEFSNRVMNDQDFPTKEVVKIEGEKIEQFNENVKYLCRLFKDRCLDSLFIKMYRRMVYFPRDIDILIRESEVFHVLNMLCEEGYAIEYSPVEIKCSKKGMMNVDFYVQLRYLSTQFFDEDFLWDKPREVSLMNTEYWIPNVNADFALSFLHVFLGHRYLSLLDFLYLSCILDRDNTLDIETILVQTEKYDWTLGFMVMMKILKDIKDSFFSSPMWTPITFPYYFSTKEIMRVCDGFKRMPRGSRAKIMIVASMLADKAYHRYQIVNRDLPFSLPIELTQFYNWSIHKLRYHTGDRKIL